MRELLEDLRRVFPRPEYWLLGIASFVVAIGSQILFGIQSEQRAFWIGVLGLYLVGVVAFVGVRLHRKRRSRGTSRQWSQAPAAGGKAVQVSATKRGPIVEIVDPDRNLPPNADGCSFAVAADFRRAATICGKTMFIVSIDPRTRCASRPTEISLRSFPMDTRLLAIAVHGPAGARLVVSGTVNSRPRTVIGTFENLPEKLPDISDPGSWATIDDSLCTSAVLVANGLIFVNGHGKTAAATLIHAAVLRVEAAERPPWIPFTGVRQLVSLDVGTGTAVAVLLGPAEDPPSVRVGWVRSSDSHERIDEFDVEYMVLQGSGATNGSDVCVLGARGSRIVSRSVTLPTPKAQGS